MRRKHPPTHPSNNDPKIPALFLSSITLNNWATFKHQKILFSPGLNALIGETGSGKSLILSALQMILGERADKKYIRKDANFTSVEAFFNCTDESLKEYFDDIGFPVVDNDIVIKRIIYIDGKSKSFLNYAACNLQTIVEFSKRFVDWVGQFESQKFLQVSYQLNMVDLYSKEIPKLKKVYGEEFLRLQKLKKHYNKLIEEQNNLRQQIDFLEYQLEEIEKLQPKNNEENLLNQKKKNFLFMDKQEKFFSESLTYLVGEITEVENANPSILDIIVKIEGQLKRNADIIGDLNYSSFIENMSGIRTALAKTSDEVDYQLKKIHQSKFEDANGGEWSQEKILNRLDHYQRLKSKFKCSANELMDKYEYFKRELANLKNTENSIIICESEILPLTTKCQDMAGQLHQLREVAAKKLSVELTKYVRELRMVDATINIVLEKNEELNSEGITSLNFLAETNPGEGYKQLKQIISGGELSRVLLACRQILAGKETISIFFFDEVDAGIGGETAISIGKALTKVSLKSQVLAITHLPQIANFASRLIVVTKEFEIQDRGKRTFSTIKEVSGDKKYSEIGNMMPI